MPFQKKPKEKPKENLITPGGWALMEALNPVERKLFMDFLKKFCQEEYERLIQEPTWHFFKRYYAYLLTKYWFPFNNWLKKLGIKTPYEKMKEKI